MSGAPGERPTPIQALARRPRLRSGAMMVAKEIAMEKTAEQLYTDLLRQLASPSAIQPSVLADTFRDVERMHSMGHITDWQLHNAREAYAKTIERDPREGAPRSAETRADERG